MWHLFTIAVKKRTGIISICVSVVIRSFAAKMRSLGDQVARARGFYVVILTCSNPDCNHDILFAYFYATTAFKNTPSQKRYNIVHRSGWRMPCIGGGRLFTRHLHAARGTCSFCPRRGERGSTGLRGTSALCGDRINTLLGGPAPGLVYAATRMQAPQCPVEGCYR